MGERGGLLETMGDDGFVVMESYAGKRGVEMVLEDHERLPALLEREKQK